MSLSTTHTIEGGPTSEIRAAFLGMEEQYGFVPNLGATMAESPVPLKALFTLYEVNEGGIWTPPERQLVYLAASATNRCSYCVAAHSMLVSHAGPSPTTVQAMHASHKLDDAKLDVLREFSSLEVAKRGHVTETEVSSFLPAGHTTGPGFEVFALVAAKIITNYANPMAHTAVDQQFGPASSEAVTTVRAEGQGGGLNTHAKLPIREKARR